MKSKSLILMVVAMGCGLVAAYTTARLTAKSHDETEKVLVASSEIKIGTVVKEPEKLFVEIDYKKGTAPNAVSDLERIKDKIVTRTVRPGQFIVPDDLSANFGITPPKGMKAMSIKVTPDAAVAGFIMPGCRVDVMATVGDQNTKPKTLMVLQNQEVLAVDRISVRPDAQSAVEQINTVTLAVTPQNAQKLELALRYSNNIVRLLLRDQHDTAITRLNPRDKIDDGTSDFGDAGGSAVQALAAKEDLKAGTVIDDPDKYFTAVNVPSLPDRGYTVADLAKLKGQKLHTTLFKDNYVTVKHFEGKDDGKTDLTAAPTPTAAPAPLPPEPVEHVLFIQNGGKEAQMFKYRDGVLVNGDQVITPARNNPPPPPPAKPEPKKEEPKTEEKAADDTDKPSEK